MATEYRLSYTASEIDEKLGKIDKIEDCVDTIEANGKKTVKIGSKFEIFDCVDGNIDIVDWVFPEDTSEMRITSRKSRNILDPSIFFYGEVISNLKDGESCSTRGQTITKQGNGTYIINGAATTQNVLPLIKSTKPLHLSAGTYRLAGCPSGGSSASYYMQWKNIDGDSNVGFDYGNGLVKTFDTDVNLRVNIVIQSGCICNNTEFKPQITEGTDAYKYDEYYADTIVITSDSIAPIRGTTSGLQSYVDYTVIELNNYGEATISYPNNANSKSFIVNNHKKITGCLSGDMPIISYTIPDGVVSIEVQSIGSSNRLNPKCLSHMDGVNNGITISSKDGKYILNGECTASGEYATIVLVKAENAILLPAGTYNLCGCYGGSVDTYRIQWRKINAETDVNEGFLAWDDGAGYKLVLTEPKKVYCQIIVYSGVNLEDVTVTPMIIDGATASNEFIEYKRSSVTISTDDITPITGLSCYDTGTEVSVSSGSATLSLPFSNSSSYDPRVNELIVNIDKISSDLEDATNTIDEITKIQHHDDAEFTVSKLNNSNQFSQNDITFVGDELWVSKESAIYYDNGTMIFRYKVDGDKFTLVGTCDCDFGHLNTMDYCAANDCLIFGNGGNSTDTTGNYFVVVKNPRSLGSTALIDDVGIKYNVDIGFKVQALWGDSNLGENNIVYLLSNNSENITKILLLKDDDGEFNGEFVTLETHELEVWGVQGADIFGGTLYIGGAVGSNEYAAVKEISLYDLTESRIVKQKFYASDGTAITGCVQGIYVNQDSVWICINSGDTTKPVCLTKYRR